MILNPNKISNRALKLINIIWDFTLMKNFTMATVDGQSPNESITRKSSKSYFLLQSFKILHANFFFKFNIFAIYWLNVITSICPVYFTVPNVLKVSICMKKCVHYESEAFQYYKIFSWHYSYANSISFWLANQFNIQAVQKKNFTGKFKRSAPNEAIVGQSNWPFS